MKTFGGGSAGKAADQGERCAIQHPTGTERGTGIRGIERRAPSGAGKESRAVHRSAASCDVKSAEGEFERNEEERDSRGGATWLDYEAGLEDRLADLHSRVQLGARGQGCSSGRGDRAQ